MTTTVSLENYFKDAPFYRNHQGAQGARYHIKDTARNGTYGLWIASEPCRFEVAIPRRDHLSPQNSKSARMGDGFEPATLAEARMPYRFEDRDIAPGDAVVDYPVFAQTEKRAYDEAFDAPPRHAQSIVRLHIPRDEFLAGYEIDGDSYFARKFRIKFATEDAFVTMPDGSVEQILRDRDVFLKGDRLEIAAPSQSSGRYQRLIDGQDLSYYIEAALEVAGRADLIGAGLGIDVAIVGISSFPPRSGKEPNPYEETKEMWRISRLIFDRAGLILGAQQQSEFDAHTRDIIHHYDYFEKNPPSP